MGGDRQRDTEAARRFSDREHGVVPHRPQMTRLNG